MRCEICDKKGIRKVVILPIPKMDDTPQTVACLSCAEESGHYCRKHGRPHLGFAGDDERTACIACIEQLVQDYASRAALIYTQLINYLPARELNRLREEAERVRRVTGTKPAIAILRFIATRAVRFECEIETMVKSLIEEGDVEVLFPHAPRSG